MQAAKSGGFHLRMEAILRVVLLMCHLEMVEADTCSYEVSLPAKYSYKEVPLPSVNVSNSLVLEIKACRDAHLAISKSLDLSKDMFEFVFGGYNNRVCMIRSCKRSCFIARKPVSVLSCTEFRKVWIAWGLPGVRLGLGEKADSNTLMTTTFGASLAVRHVWISMYHQNTGDWRINCRYDETSTLTEQNVATSTTTPTSTAQSVMRSDQLTTRTTPDTAESTMIGPRTSLDLTTTTIVNTTPPNTAGNTPISAEASTPGEESDINESTSTSVTESVTFVTNTSKQETTATPMENSATIASAYSAPRCCCEQVRLMSMMRAKEIVEELMLKEQTSAKRRRLESASDNRRSAQLMGLTAVAVLVTVSLVVMGPDLINLFVWTAGKLHLVKKHRKGLKTSR